MQFIDLKAQQKRIREDIENRIYGVLDHGKYIMGPEITELEQALAEFSGVKYAMGCASGTDALLLAIMAHGVKPGDPILTTPFTFIATAEVVSLIGAVPVFVDIEPDTFNMDPKALEKVIQDIKTKGGVMPKGIIGVDIFGQTADYDKINAIAQEHGMFVIEDAAQSYGASYKGKGACSLASIGCTSFFPAKPLGCYGDGGMCFTDDEGLDKVMRSLRVHGQGGNKYDNVRIGINGRLDSIQAAILLSKFSLFPEELELRQQAADRYGQLMGDSDLAATPFVEADNKSAWAQYTLLAKDQKLRDPILEHMKGKGVPTMVYYPKPLHLQDAFADLGYKEGDFPVTEDCAARVFSLPMHPYLTQEDQESIVKALLAFKA